MWRGAGGRVPETTPAPGPRCDQTAQQQAAACGRQLGECVQEQQRGRPQPGSAWWWSLLLPSALLYGHPGATRSHQERPGATRSHQEPPGATRSDQRGQLQVTCGLALLPEPPPPLPSLGRPPSGVCGLCMRSVRSVYAVCVCGLCMRSVYAAGCSLVRIPPHTGTAYGERIQVRPAAWGGGSGRAAGVGVRRQGPAPWGRGPDGRGCRGTWSEADWGRGPAVRPVRQAGPSGRYMVSGVEVRSGRPSGRGCRGTWSEADWGRGSGVGPTEQRPAARDGPRCAGVEFRVRGQVSAAGQGPTGVEVQGSGGHAAGDMHPCGLIQEAVNEGTCRVWTPSRFRTDRH